MDGNRKFIGDMMRMNVIVAVLLLAGIFSGCIWNKAPEPAPETEVKPKYPIALISTSAKSMEVGGDPIIFDASNSIGAVSYLWEFGDGQTATGISVEHSYEEPGYYSVNLTVTSASGAKDTDSVQVVAWVKLEDSITEWSEPSTIGLIYPDYVKAELLTRPIFIFFWHEGCPWCTVQEAGANEVIDEEYLGTISILKMNTHTDLGRLWAREYFHLMYVPTNIVLRQDGMFVALIGTATFGVEDPTGAAGSGDLKKYLDEALQYKSENKEKMNITEMDQNGIISPASPEVEVPVDLNNTMVLTAWVKWDIVPVVNASLISASSLDIVITAPNGTQYSADEIEPYDATKTEVPGNIKGDPYRTITIPAPVAGTWKIKLVPSDTSIAATYALHVLTRGGGGQECQGGVCPP